MGVAVAIVGGLLLAWLLPNFLGPDLRLVTWSSESGGSDTVTLTIQLHNDNNKSAVGCVGYWKEETLDGVQLLGDQSAVFWVPGQGDAVTLYPPNLPPTFHYSVRDIPAWGTQTISTIYVTCDGYRSRDWHSFSTW